MTAAATILEPWRALRLPTWQRLPVVRTPDISAEPSQVRPSLRATARPAAGQPRPAVLRTKAICPPPGEKVGSSLEQRLSFVTRRRRLPVREILAMCVTSRVLPGERQAASVGRPAGFAPLEILSSCDPSGRMMWMVRDAPSSPRVKAISFREDHTGSKASRARAVASVVDADVRVLVLLRRALHRRGTLVVLSNTMLLPSGDRPAGRLPALSAQ